jgi:collagenase-like PrtC family protease
LNLLDELPSLVKANVDTIRIDTFLHETEWVIQTTKIYLDALKHSDDPNYLTQLVNQLPKEDYSRGFYLMKKSDLIYLKQSEGTYE